jgi:4-amino-4-deoxy-L-arabinose transferase-like glycosyltransferase
MTKNARAKWAGPGLVLLANLVMLLWFWGRAPDPVIDFGREIYMPWRITEGQHLYRDFTYFNGPFSPYFNAVIFKIFGVSLQTLTIANLVLAMGMTALLYRMLIEIGDRWSATIALVLMPFVFTFGQLNYVANFNWITPYSHDLTHGILLSLGMIGALWMLARKRRIGWAVLSGALLGLVFLTKAEVFLAALLAGIGGLIVVLRSDADRKRRWLTMVFFLIAAIVPPVVAFALLRSILPTRDVVFALEGSWRWLGNRELLGNPYFKLINGTDHLAANIATTLLWAAGYALITAAIAGIALILPPSRRLRGTFAISSAVVVFVALCFVWMKIEWPNFIRPAQLFMTAGGITLLVLIVRRWKDRDAVARLALPFMLVIFAGALLGKILWNVRVVHYGFALSLLATLLTINAVVYWSTRIVKSRGGSPEFVRAIWIALILIACGQHFLVDFVYLKKKQYVVASGGDAFLADIRGKMINEASDFLLEHTRPDQTLVAMPEGFLLNYLTRRVNPTIYHQFTPPNLIMYGQDNIVTELQAHPPDVIALVHVDNIEYGARFFGRNYGQKIWDWVFANYEPMVKPNGETALFGYPPFVNEKNGVLLVQRKQAH